MKIKIKKLLKEEIKTVVSEGLGSDEGNFIAAYRAYLMNQGEQDVTVATTAAEQALEVLKNTGSSIEGAIEFISSKNIQARKDYVVNNPSSSRQQYRSWHGPDQSDGSGYPHPSRNEE